MRPALFIKTILAVALLLGCGRPALSQSSAEKLPRQMKGYELYSWKTRGGWHFALLVGTNRLKTRGEVTSPRVRVKGVEALKRKLGGVAEGEEVTWVAGRVAGTALPPGPIVDEVKNYCARHGIRLAVSEPPSVTPRR